MTRNRRKIVVGRVVSDKMDKTITVRTERLEKHALYKKYLKRFTTYKAHDENNEAAMDDLVEIQETRPISKQKRWRLISIVEKGAAAVETK